MRAIVILITAALIASALACNNQRLDALEERMLVLEEKVQTLVDQEFEDRCKSDGNLYFNGNCFFFSGTAFTVQELINMTSTDEELTQEEFINNLQAIYRNTSTDCETNDASLAEIRSVQMQNAVLDYAIRKFKYVGGYVYVAPPGSVEVNLSEDGIFASSFWIGGEFTFSSNLIAFTDGTQLDADELTWTDLKDDQNPDEARPIFMVALAEEELSGLVSIHSGWYETSEAVDPMMIPTASLCQVNRP